MIAGKEKGVDVDSIERRRAHQRQYLKVEELSATAGEGREIVDDCRGEQRRLQILSATAEKAAELVSDGRGEERR